MSGDPQLRRSIREGARRQLGTFGVPSYITIGDPFKDGSEKAPGGRWTRPLHSPGVTLRPAQREEDAPPAPPFMTGAQLSRSENTVHMARYRSHIKSESKAGARTPRSERAPPWALHDPSAYDDSSIHERLAHAAASGPTPPGAPEPALQRPPSPQPPQPPQPQMRASTAQLPPQQPLAYLHAPLGYLQPGQQLMSAPYATPQPTGAAYAQARPAAQQPMGAPLFATQPPPLLLLPATAAGASVSAARRGPAQRQPSWQPPLASFPAPGYPGLFMLVPTAAPPPGAAPMMAYGGYDYGRQ